MRHNEVAEAQKTYRNCGLKRPQVQKPKSIEKTGIFLDSHKSRVVSTMTCPTVEDMGIPSPQSRAEARNDGKATTISLRNLEKICAATMCATCVYRDVRDPSEVEFIRTRIADSLSAIADHPVTGPTFSLDGPASELPQEPTLGQ